MEGNEQSESTVAVCRNDLVNEYIVGHISLHFSKGVCKFLQLSNSKLNLSRSTRYGLEIAVTCSLWGRLRGKRVCEKRGCTRIHPYQGYGEKVLKINTKK